MWKGRIEDNFRKSRQMSSKKTSAKEEPRRESARVSRCAGTYKRRPARARKRTASSSKFYSKARSNSALNKHGGDGDEASSEPRGKPQSDTREESGSRAVARMKRQLPKEPSMHTRTL